MAMSLTRICEDGSDRLMALCIVVQCEVFSFVVRIQCNVCIVRNLVFVDEFFLFVTCNLLNVKSNWQIGQMTIEILLNVF